MIGWKPSELNIMSSEQVTSEDFFLITDDTAKEPSE